MLVEVGKFTFSVDFVILEMEEDSKFPLILRRPFLHTADAVIRVKQKQLNLEVRTEIMIFHIDSAMKHSYSNDDTCFSIDVIDEILEEDFDAILDEGSEILHSIEGTILKEKLFAEFEELMAMTADKNSESESNTEEPPFEKITFNTDYKIKTCLEEPYTNLELKPLLDNLVYVFLEEPSFLPVIISSQIFEENKNKLVSILKRHKQAFAWKTTDIPRIYPSFSTFQRCMMAIFHDMIEESVKVFVGDFSVFGSSFDHCLNNINKMLQRCKDAHLVLNREKCHFMVKEGMVLGHEVFKAVAIDYVSKWAEAQALTTKDFRVVITFLKKLFCHFGMPKALISDRGTHFCNKIMEKTMKRYGVNHRFATSYHPQTSGQVENTNTTLKRILEKTIKDNHAIWSRKLDDALWAFRTAYKTSTGTTPYKLIYEKNCHLPFEIEHRAYWALKNCNPDLIATGEKRMFQLHELYEL
nr:reverse transcriptase domain-containing protein [Tanacetum cinerariifolium]